MAKILIVDDHLVLADLFCKLFEQEENYQVIGKLTCANQIQDFCKKKKPDLVLLDVCTENGASGIEAAGFLKNNYPGIKVIMMSGFDEISFSSKAKAAGADAFIYKSKSLDFFMKVIQDVMEGKNYFPELKSIPLPAGEPPFTEREMELLQLICRFKSRNEISEQLNISENTVKYHIKNMLAKTGTSSTAELAVYVVAEGWINPKY